MFKTLDDILSGTDNSISRYLHDLAGIHQHVEKICDSRGNWNFTLLCFVYCFVLILDAALPTSRQEYVYRLNAEKALTWLLEKVEKTAKSIRELPSFSESLNCLALNTLPSDLQQGKYRWKEALYKIFFAYN